MSLKNYCYRYPHAALTVDCCIFGLNMQTLKVLLIERGIEPYKGMWALPGGFMKMDETVEEAARRELFEETGLKDIYMQQFKVFSKVDRDPRERVVTVVFIALLRPEDYQLTAGDDASNALWFDTEELPPIAFDHREIIKEARTFLSELIKVKPVAFQLLSKNFTMSELQTVYEVINKTHYDRRNFQRKAIQSGLIEELEVIKPMASSAPSDLSVSDRFPSARPSLAGRPSKLFSLKINFKKNSSLEDDENEIKDDAPESEDNSIRNLFDY